MIFFNTNFSQINPLKKWKGNSIIGNGNICVVYSDDSRISQNNGIQQFYYKDYTNSYIASTHFELVDEFGISLKQNKLRDTLLMKSFFSPQKISFYSDGISSSTNTFVHNSDAVISRLTADGENNSYNYNFIIAFRKNIINDKFTKLISLENKKDFVIVTFSNGVKFLVGSKSESEIIAKSDSTLLIKGSFKTNSYTDILILPGISEKEIVERFQNLKKKKNLYSDAEKYWNNWISKGRIPKFNEKNAENILYVEYFKRNIYAAKSSNLNGQVPADMTGQFVTNNMPQLYPRDAMKVARIFILAEFYDEAEKIIRFWTHDSIPKKSLGEFFARYDANAKAVDGGTGARFDEPEWDANGYMIQLINMFYQKKKIWLADKNFIFEIADFLVQSIDNTGLLYEGGIVEWTGYLPATNMICAAALKTASEIAYNFGDKQRADSYLAASKTISDNLHKMYDVRRNTYADVRFHGMKRDNFSITEKSDSVLFLWDTSVMFGFIWGYENHEKLENTYKFILANNTKFNGGVQYFEALDAGLSAYGNDLFFFTTAASAQYAAKTGKIEKAKLHIDWMIRNANIYGLMPERIYLNQTDCSVATPLSWCSAEFAASLLVWSKNHK